MQVQNADTVWARIDALARAEPGGAVATDGDGTLWAGDVGEDLFHAFIEAGRVEPPATEALRRDARDHGVSDAGGGADVARRIFEAYCEGRFPEERVCELMTWCFAGWTRTEVRAFARDTVDRGRLDTRIHAEVMQTLDRARAAGISIVLVSASPVAVVVEAASRVGFDEGSVVASRARFDREVMLPDVERPIPYGAGKVTGLRALLGHRPLYAAFGDNAFDVAMLGAARVPVAVRPKPRLRAQAGAVPGLVELAASGAPAPGAHGTLRG